MAGSVPWSVNAVDPDAWADARDAARRSGQSVGEWLESTIRDAAHERHERRERHELSAPRPPARQDTGSIERRLDDIAERIETFARQTRETAPARNGRSDAAVLSSIEALNERIDSLSRDVRSGERSGPVEVRAAIQKLEDRIDHLLSRSRVAESGISSELERKLETISHSIESMGRRLAQENANYESMRYEPTRVPSTVEDLDNAVAEIMMRQAALDGVPPPRSMPRNGRSTEHVRTETQRTPAYTPPPPPDFSGLERQLKLMSDEMQALRQSGTQGAAIGALREEIGELAAKLGELAPRRSLEAIERTVDSIAMRLDRTGGGRQDQTLTEVVDSLHDIRAALADVRPAESFVSVEKDLRALSGKLDNLGGRGMDSGAVARLQEQTAEIRDLLSGALPSDVLRALVEQIEVLVAKFEHRSQEPDNAIVDVMSAFDRRLEALSDRIEAATRQTPAIPALDDIRQRLDELQDSVVRTEARPDDRVEATLRALANKVEATDARLANLGAIERGLADLFAQFQEARDSAHEAAEQAAKSVVREMAAAQPRTTVEISRRAPGEPLETRYSSGMDLHAPSTQPSQPAARVELRPVSPLRPAPVAESIEDAEPDYPLEPGSGVPRVRLQSAALRVAQSEAALGGLSAPASETPGRASDYIAAARRAAQAANAEPAPEADRPAEPALRGRLASLFGRRTLLIGLTLCLLAIAALRLFDGQLPIPFRSSGAPAPAPVAVPPKAETPMIKSPVPPVSVTPAPARQGEAVLPADSLNGAPPAGVLADNRDLHFSGAIAADTETTGSTVPSKQVTTSIQSAAAPAQQESNTAASDTSSAGDALPAALGPAALRAAAAAGDPAASYEIGVRYLDGRGVRADAAEAAEWLEKAYAKGAIPAAYRLGSIHEKGMNGRKDTAQAVRYYLAAAERGNIKAMHNLAVIHAEGPDGKPDMKSAVRWFRMAAERAVRDSQYNLGVIYARGLGVDQNFAESYRWFALAANQGDADAGKKRDDIAKRLDVQTLVAAKLAVQTWAAAKIDPAANEVLLKPEWEKAAEAPARKRTVKK